MSFTAEYNCESPAPVFALKNTSALTAENIFFIPEDCVCGGTASHLFHTRTTGCVQARKKSESSVVKPVRLSTRYKTTSATSERLRVNSTPFASIASSVCRSPAVSKSRTGMPLKSAQLSSQSRVVPSISETIARSSFKTALNKLDFPAFVLPQSTRRAPS